ncbi:hypothetical protein [Burkholderia pseudomallei]|uniref:hypothetical protein n=1 Tax=Burkholderia pseudomallei TaxID=28450 RepID=UPI0013225CD6|nr:hypothetical protein [Burkholderia pseudomallei]MWA18064.1 hypothetical protein [Burkholderia pseudomallei]
MIDQNKMRALAAHLRGPFSYCTDLSEEAANAIDLLLTRVEAIEQAILNPENQPSQYRTVLLEAARKESDSLMSALAECRDAMPHRDSCDAELMQAIGDPGAVPIYVKAVVTELLAELKAAAADKRNALAFRDLMAAVIRNINHGEYNRPYRGIENAPDHAHDMPGIWDSDNGAKAGTQCAWCATWNAARAALAQRQGEGS